MIITTYLDEDGDFQKSGDLDTIDNALQMLSTTLCFPISIIDTETRKCNYTRVENIDYNYFLLAGAAHSALDLLQIEHNEKVYFFAKPKLQGKVFELAKFYGSETKLRKSKDGDTFMY